MTINQSGFIIANGIKNLIAPSHPEEIIPTQYTGKDVAVDSSFTNTAQLQNTSTIDYLAINPLDGFINVKQNLKLSIVQFDSNQASSHENFLALPSYPIASSDLSSTMVHTDRYFQITEFTMKNVVCQVAPTEELAQVIEASMVINEPYGLSFYSQVDNIAGTLADYGNVSHVNIVWKLEISFGGWDADGAYTEKIPFRNRYDAEDNEVTDATFFFIFTNVEADMEGGNTTYSISMVPFSQRGLQSESSLIPYDIEIPLKPSNNDQVSFDGETFITFEKYIEKLTAALNIKQGEVIKERIEKALAAKPGEEGGGSAEKIEAVLRNYKFTIPESLKDASEGGQKLLELNSDFFKSNNSLKISNNNIVSELTAKLSMLKIVQKSMSETYPKIMYSVRTELDYSGTIKSSVLGDLVNIGINFIIYEQVDYRYNPQTEKQRKTTNSDRFYAILNSGAIRRTYQYMFSSANSEVIKFKVGLKNVWYNSIEDPYAGIDFRSTVSTGTTSGTSNTPNIASNTDETTINNLRETLNPASVTEKKLSETRLSYTGQQTKAHKRNTSFLNPENVRDHNAYWNNFYAIVDIDNIKEPLDNLEVRGDPRWLFNIDNTKSVKFGESTRVLSDLIYIEVRQPSQTEYMSENYSEKPKFDADFSGFYQVLTVTHTFSEGKYIQKFTGNRINIYDPIIKRETK